MNPSAPAAESTHATTRSSTTPDEARVLRAEGVTLSYGERRIVADLDVAIDGHGYLEVTLPSGVSGYTRDGGLKRSADGQIVTSDGYPLVPGITIPAEARSISISPVLPARWPAPTAITASPPAINGIADPVKITLRSTTR